MAEAQAGLRKHKEAPFCFRAIVVSDCYRRETERGDEEWRIMKSNAIKSVRCIHCLRLTESPEADHVFPDSWYPDSTPPTVPSAGPHQATQNATGSTASSNYDLLIRLVLSTDPNSDAASGLAARVFRSLGLDVEGLPEKEKTIRDGLRARIRSEFIPHGEVAELPGRIPGLGPAPQRPLGAGNLHTMGCSLHHG